MLRIGFQRQYREHYSNYVAVEDNAVSHICMFTRPGMRVRSLGTFRIELPPEDPDLQTVRKLVEEHGLSKKALVSHPVRPGAQLVSFTIIDGSSTVVHSEQTAFPLPEPLAALEEALMDIAGKSLRQGFRSIHIESALSKDRIQSGETVEIRLSFVNQGSLPARIKNPAAVPRVGGCAISFLVWSNPSSESAQPEYLATIETTDVEFLISSRRALRSDARHIELGPGERVSASLALPFAGHDPGRYHLQLVYNSSGTLGAEQELVIGGYHGDPLALTVM